LIQKWASMPDDKSIVFDWKRLQGPRPQRATLATALSESKEKKGDAEAASVSPPKTDDGEWVKLFPDVQVGALWALRSSVATITQVSFVVYL
jgi:hypothetical protein